MEILFKDKFPIENKELYPGDYLIDIAKNIIDQNKNITFENSILEKAKKIRLSNQ